jgi:hypothetical protein
MDREHQQADDVIDLGAASVETQGSGGQLYADGNQFRNTPFDGIVD